MIQNVKSTKSFPKKGRREMGFSGRPNPPPLSEFQDTLIILAPFDPLGESERSGKKKPFLVLSNGSGT